MTQNEVDVVNEIENGLYSEFSWLFRDSNKYIAMVKVVENAVDKYSKQIRKQVCDEIRNAIEVARVQEMWEEKSLDISKILDQIEKGEQR